MSQTTRIVNRKYAHTPVYLPTPTEIELLARQLRESWSANRRSRCAGTGPVSVPVITTRLISRSGDSVSEDR